MKIDIVSPTKALVKTSDPTELASLKKIMSYVDTSVSFLLSKHKKNRWFKQQNPVGWESRLKELTIQLKNKVWYQDGSDIYIRPSSLDGIKQGSWSISNHIHYPDIAEIPWKTPIPFTPYQYQTESVENFLKYKHGHVTLATGLGKSLILLMIAQRIGDCLIVTPSKSIFSELLSLFTLHLGKQMVGGYGDGKKDIKKPITVAIGKSLTMIQKDTPEYQFMANKKALLVDESHSWAANTLEKVCHGVASEIPYRFFASATQISNSGKDLLLESIIGRELIGMDIGEGIEGGYLCPLKFNVLTTKSPSYKTIKDPMKCKREHFLYNSNIATIASKIANLGWIHNQQSTLILVEELRQISMLQDLLTVPFGYVHSGSKKDAEKWDLEKVSLQEEVDRFNNGHIKVLIGTKAIATGTNLYPTHQVINWVGGGSEIVTKQGAMGRSTRKLDISKYAHLHKPKPFSRIFDFNIEGEPMLEKQLKKRIAFYKESNGEIIYP